MSELFRREAISHATRRLSGTVVLATPLTVRLLGLFFGVIVIAAVLFASLATYARKATVTGWLIPDLGLIRATAVAAGSVQAVGVSEGAVVESGARLAEIRIGSDTAAGNVGEISIGRLDLPERAEQTQRRSRVGGAAAQPRADGDVLRQPQSRARRDAHSRRQQTRGTQHEIVVARLNGERIGERPVELQRQIARVFGFQPIGQPGERDQRVEQVIAVVTPAHHPQHEIHLRRSGKLPKAGHRAGVSPRQASMTSRIDSEPARLNSTRCGRLACRG